MAKCAIPGCANSLPTHARCKTCKNCRQSMGSYLRKPMAALVKRVANLTLYTNRMSNIRGHNKKVW